MNLLNLLIGGSDMNEREKYIFESARSGKLQMREIKTGADAMWATLGYEVRSLDPDIYIEDRKEARDFVIQMIGETEDA
jgi:hypothetical protein